MANNDFFLDFGSNASSFARKLAADLAPAKATLAALKTEIAEVNTALDLTGRKARQAGGLVGGGGGGSGGGSHGAGDVDWAGMGRDIAEYNASLGKVFGQIEKIVKVLGPVSKEMRDAQKRQNRSDGGVRSAENRGRRADGTFAAKGEAASIRNVGGKAAKVEFATTPKVMIDEAAFKRVVNALDRNTAALKAIRKGGGVPVTPASKGSATDAPTVSSVSAKMKGLDAKLAQIAELMANGTDEQKKVAGEVIASVKAERASLRQEDTEKKALQAEKKAARRADAQAQREAQKAARGDQGLNAQQRANVQRDLDLAGGGESALRKLPKEDLRRIAMSMQGEGFSAGFNPMQTKAGGKLVTNDRLIQAILKMDADLVKTGKTFHDLSTGKRKVTPDSVTKDVRAALRELINESKITPGEQQAFDIRRQDRQSGGFGPANKGRQQVGGDFQQGDAARWVHAAEALINERNEKRLPAASIDSALKQMSRGRNVFDPAFDAGIQGKGDEAKDARSALSKVRRATDAIDKLVKEFINLQKKIADTEKSLDKMDKERTKLERSATQTPQDAQRIAHLTELQGKAQERLSRLQGKASGMTQGDNAFIGQLASSPKYLSGLAARENPRQALAAKREERALTALAIAEERRAQRLGSADALAGARTKTKAKAGGGGPEDYARGLPGLVPGNERSRNAGTLRALNPSDVDPALLAEVNKAKAAFDSTYSRIATMRKAEVKDVQGIAKLEAQAKNDLTRLFNAYDQMKLTEKGYGQRRAHIADDGTPAYDAYYGETASKKSARKARVAGESDEAYAARLAALEADKTEKGKKAATQRTKAATDEAKAAKDIADASAKDVKSAKQRNQAADLTAAQANRDKQSGKVGTGGQSSAQKKRNADIAGERGSQDYAAIVGALSTTTKKEIEYYRALVATNQEGKNNVKIAEQQVKLYAMMANELGALGRSSSGIRQSFQTVSANVGQQTTVPGAQGIGRSANMRGLISSQSPQMAQEATNVRDVIAGKLFGNHGFWSRVANSTGTFIIRNFTAGIVFGLTAALSDVVRQAIVTESTFVRVSHALEATGRASGDLRTQLQGISTDYGTSLEDVYTTAAGLTGLFDSIDEIAGATRVSAQLQMISGGALNATEAMGALASITSAFGDQLGGLDGLEHIADVLTVIQNRVGVNIEVTAEGVGRLAGLAHQIGLTFEETAVYVGEIAKKTNQTGAAAGEQFSRIVAVMQTGRGQKALTDSLGEKGIGAALGAGDYGQAIQILMKNYNDLTEAQQRNIAVTLGGQRQAASLAALLKDGASALDTVKAAEDSRGQAEKRATAISKTLNVVLERFQQNLVTLGANLVRSGVLDFFGLLLLGVNKVLASANTLLSVFNDFADTNGFTHWIANATLAVLGLGLALKVLKAGMAGLGAYLKASPARAAGVAAVQGSLAGVAPAGGETIAQRARRVARDRVVRAATFTRTGPEMTTAPRSALNPFGGANRIADPLSGPTSRLGRGMEAVTAGPLRRLGSGLDTLSTRFGRLSNITGDLGQSRRSAILSGTGSVAGWTGRRAGELSQAAQLTLRGRGDLVAEAASRRLARGASSIRDSASAVAGTGMRATLSRTGLNAVAGSAAVASTSMSRLAVGLRAVSFGGAAAQGAMAGLTLVITAVITEMVRASEYAKDVKNAYEASFGSDRNKSAAEKAESYVGPATDAVRANRDLVSGGIGGYMKALGQTFNPANAFRDVGEIGDRSAGNLSTDKLNELSKPWAEGLDKLKATANQSFSNVDDQVTQLQTDAKGIQDELKAKADEIANDSSLSSEQKATGLAALEASKKSIEEITSSLILRVQGLADLNKLTASRIDELNNMSGFLAQSPTAGANYGSSVNLLMQNSGAGQGTSAMDKAFKALAAGQGGTADVLRNQLDITNGLIKAADANLRSKLNNGEPEEVEAAAQQLQTLITNAEGYKRQIIDAETKSANDLATYLSGRGDYAGAEKALASAAENLRNSVDASKRELERRSKAAKDAFSIFKQDQTAPGVSLTPDVLTDDEATQRLNQAADLGGQSVTAGQQAKTKELRAAARNTRNAVALASLQEQIAQIKLKTIKEAFEIGNATQDQVDAASEEAINAGRNTRDQAQAARSAGYAAASAGQLNAVNKSRTDEAGAWQAMAYAGQEFGRNSAEYLNALAAARSASQATQQALLDQAAAQRDTALAMMAPGDMVGRANKTLSNARAAQKDALRFGKASTQYQQATQQVIEAQRGVDSAVYDVADANSNLAITIATSAGKMVDVANLKLDQAEKELARAKKQSGGKRTTGVINAEAGVKQAKADQRDAILQDRLDQIDFMKNMDQITSQGAIGMLTDLLNMKDLTEQQRRDILLRIKGLQDELNSSLQGAFNLPDQVKVPSVYEVRRALGINDYLKNMNEALAPSQLTSGGGTPTSSGRAAKESMQAAAAKGVPTKVEDYSNSNNNVTINGADFAQVVEWIKKYMGSGAQVTRTTTPRRK